MTPVRFDSLGLGDIFIAKGRVWEHMGEHAKQLICGWRDDRFGEGFQPWSIVEPITIVSNHDYPPIPVRTSDWSAHLDDYDGAPDAGFQPVGRGISRRDAIVDLAYEIESHLED